MNEYIVSMSIPNIRTLERYKHCDKLNQFYKWKKVKLKNKVKKASNQDNDDECIEYIPKGKLLELINENEVYAVDEYLEELQKIEGVY